MIEVSRYDNDEIMDLEYDPVLDIYYVPGDYAINFERTPISGVDTPIIYGRYGRICVPDALKGQCLNIRG